MKPQKKKTAQQILIESSYLSSPILLWLIIGD
jgi:hypothetical protein